MVLRFALSTATAVLTLVASTLVTGTFSAPTAEAAKDKPNNNTPIDLTGVAYNFNGASEDSIVFLTNTDAGHAIRAVVTARDSTGALIGCGIKVLQPGGSGVVYIITSANTASDWSENVLNVKVFGLTATGTMFTKVASQDGLAGTIAQVDSGSGATKSIVPLIETPALVDDRQAQMDECLTPGAGNALAMAGGTNIVTTEQPAKWSKLAKDSKKN
jgi:hypothetical protein